MNEWTTTQRSQARDSKGVQGRVWLWPQVQSQSISKAPAVLQAVLCCCDAHDRAVGSATTGGNEDISHRYSEAIMDIKAVQHLRGRIDVSGTSAAREAWSLIEM